MQQVYYCVHTSSQISFLVIKSHSYMIMALEIIITVDRDLHDPCWVVFSKLCKWTL